ncbi:MAG: four helix bundle protein [Campylobacterales bacterium]|nr:four helix bundle protein [Campylobacterales bacterium]
MSGKVIVLDKSFDFAIRIVNLYRHLCNDKKEFILSKQLLRSGTSIGANVNEAQAGQSKVDFISKMSIASKEAREAKYWIELLIKTDYLNIEEVHVKSLLEEINELIKIITSIVKTSKENNR